MSKLIWIDNLLLFKITNVYLTQYLCVCSNQYKDDLDMKVGDIVFIKDRIYPNLYRRLGEIKGFNNNRNVIIGVMGDIGIGSKSKMEKLHYVSIEEVEEEL